MLDGHGDDLYRYGSAIRHNFSSNVRPGGTPQGLLEAIRARFEECSRYPDPGARALARKIARHHQVDASSVMVTAGTVEGIYLLASAFRRGRAIIAIPTFSEYADACRIHEIEPRSVRWPVLSNDENDCALLRDLQHALSAFPADLVFLCNPNNPTGDVTPLPEIRRLIQSHPKTVFVLDEAYIEFAPSAGTAIPLLSEYANLVVLRSLTKSFAIPGLRLGYLLGAPSLLDRLCHVRTPWTVSVPALIAGETILERYDALRLDPALLLESKESLYTEISRLRGFFPRRSQTHYFLVRTERGTAASLKEFLADDKGILIRDASNFAGLDAHWFRVAAQSPEENRLLAKALDEWRG